MRRLRARARALRGLAKEGALTALLASVALVAFAPSEADAATWRLEQPAPPAGSPYKVPLGRPGDLQCWTSNRCLLAVEGNAVVRTGLYVYDGAEWRPLATVCGGPADTTRIVWAGPTEFWTITTPSLPRRTSPSCSRRSTIRRAILLGTAKPMPTLAPLRLRMAVLMPMR